MTTERTGLASDWGRDPLSEFMNTAETRLHETHRDLHDSWWSRLLAIDRTFVRACEHLNETSEMVGALLLLRAHSAYRAGVRLAGSGQVPEAYMVLRGCLEYGLNGAFMAEDPERQKRWLTRSDTPANRKRFRSEFTAGAMLKSAGARSKRVGSVARTLYGHLIDFGAHPTDLGLGATTTPSESADVLRFEASYIVGDGVLARGSLQTAARVGICTLWLFKLVFATRFEILGIDVELESLGQGL